MDSTTATITDFSALKALVPLAVPAVKATIDSWLVPTLSKMKRSKELSANTQPEQVQKAFSEYLIRTYGRLSFMNTIVFGNQQKRIQDLYIPLTVRSTCSKQVDILIESWRRDFVPTYKRVVITDTAGMGKSTILKWLFLCSIGNSEGIPIFIELRTLSAQKSILDRIYEELCPIDKPFDKDLLLQLIRSGNFIFFLDGFDEVTYDDRRKVTEDIQEFIGKALNNLFLLASRRETALGSFGDFKEFSINPLKKKEAYNLLRRYDETGEHASALIGELEQSKYEQLKDLLVNPMLVSLLYKAYSYKPKVPFKKQIFYRQVFDALFDMHDSTKGGAFVRKKHSNLDIDEFHLIMRDLGFTTAKVGKIEYEKDEICEIIKKVRERNSTILFQPAALLNDLVTTVPLFNKEGEHFKWAHKSVQDYFASQFIALDAKGDEDALLTRIYEGGHCRRFENVLDMLHDTDNKSFRRVLLARFLKDYINHYEARYQAIFPGISLEEIEKRKQLTFGQEVAVVFVKVKSLNQILSEFHTGEIDKRFAKVLPMAVGTEVFFSEIKDGYIVVARRPGPAAGLLPLLLSKKYPYVNKCNDGWGKMVKKRFHSIVWDAAPTLVTDKPECLLNSPKNFGLINLYLAHSGFLIPIENARRTLRSLEEESRDSQSNNHLLANL